MCRPASFRLTTGAALDPGLRCFRTLRQLGGPGGSELHPGGGGAAAGSKSEHQGKATDPEDEPHKKDGRREKNDQATKGTRWMPRRQEARKDVGSCEKRRGAANQALIRRCPNGETHGG